MVEPLDARPRCGKRIKDFLKRFRPTADHLAAAERELLLAVKSAIEAQVTLIDEWRARHTRPEPL